RFLATQQYWPNGKELVFRFRLFSKQVCWFWNFFISLWDKDNQPIQVHLDHDCYVPELMDPETLDNVSRVFHIKYTRMDEDSSADVIVLSGSEPSDDQFSSDGDEDNDQDGALVGDNPHNPIDLSMNKVSYEKNITASDLGQSRL
ncbi:hypothetical protein S245_048174, partial [Arachis hypogaea]